MEQRKRVLCITYLTESGSKKCSNIAKHFCMSEHKILKKMGRFYLETDFMFMPEISSHILAQNYLNLKTRNLKNISFMIYQKFSTDTDKKPKLNDNTINTLCTSISYIFNEIPEDMIIEHINEKINNGGEDYIKLFKSLTSF